MKKRNTADQKPHKCVIYSRVSTRDQEPRNQLRQLREFATSQGWEIAREYIDKETGASRTRPEFRSMMDAAMRREFDLVLFWSLDRFTREGVAQTFDYLSRLKAVGVQWHNFQLPETSTSSPMAEMFLAVSAAWAAIERQQISARSIAGIERARAEGKAIGRPQRVVDLQRILDLQAEGLTPEQIGKQLRVSSSTVKRRLKQAAAAAPVKPKRRGRAAASQ